MSYIFRSKYIAYVSLTSWAYCIGGQHFTAKAYCGNDSIDNIDYKLSRSQTLSLNRKDDYYFPDGRYKVGERCDRFFTEEQAIVEGIRACRKKWKTLKVIIQGDRAVAQPQQIAWCPNDKNKNGLNVLYEAMELLYEKNNGPWTNHRRTMQKICDRWETLMEKAIR